MSTYASLRLKQQIADVLRNPESCATTLLAVLIDSYGTECFTWEPLTLAADLQADFGVMLPEINEDKIWGGITLLTTDQFFRNLEAFNAIANSLNNDRAQFEQFDPPDAAELAWAVMEASLLLGEDYDPRMFTPEMRTYFGQILFEENITTPHPVLKMAIIPARNGISYEMAPDDIERLQRGNQDSNTEIDQYVRAKLTILFQQLQVLQLPEAAEDWPDTLKKMMATLDS